MTTTPINFIAIDAPVGELTIAADSAAIVDLHISGDRYFAGPPSNWIHDARNVILKQAEQELTQYFAGKRTAFTVPVHLQGTVFQQAVWQVLRTIEPGQTLTYAAIAAKIGKPKAVRAVGTAVGRNRICIIIPCHRVVPVSGGLGQYVAGVDRKQQLLDLEGYTYNDTKSH